MCQTFENGGHRCTSCTEPAFREALETYISLRDTPDPNLSVSENFHQLNFALSFLREAARPYSYADASEVFIYAEILIAREQEDAPLMRVLSEVLHEGYEVKLVQVERTYG
jgi:hypothetical protein